MWTKVTCALRMRKNRVRTSALSRGRHVERPVRQSDGPRDGYVDSTLADDDSDAAGVPVAGQILVSQYRQLVTQAAMQLAAPGAEVSWLPPSSPWSPP